jgi:hypothetical protein
MVREHLVEESLIRVVDLAIAVVIQIRIVRDKVTVSVMIIRIEDPVPVRIRVRVRGYLPIPACIEPPQVRDPVAVIVLILLVGLSVVINILVEVIRSTVAVRVAIDEYASRFIEAWIARIPGAGRIPMFIFVAAHHTRRDPLSSIAPVATVAACQAVFGTGQSHCLLGFRGVLGADVGLGEKAEHGGAAIPTTVRRRIIGAQLVSLQGERRDQ